VGESLKVADRVIENNKGFVELEEIVKRELKRIKIGA
jgi:dephospho-CoA kinase